MSGDKIKIKNPNSWDVGINYMNGVEFNIKAGSVFYIPSDELDVLASKCKLFQKKHLIILDEDFDKSSLNIQDDFMEDKDILDKMKKNNATLKKFLEQNIENVGMKKRVFNIAKELDLVASKIKMIEKYTGFSFRDEE